MALQKQKTIFRLKNPFKDGSKKVAAAVATFAGFFLLGLSLVTILAVSADSERLEEDSELTYYLDVRYDGVDKNGIASSDSATAEVNSGIITVTDRIPDGLIFQSFVTTQNGTIGSVQRNDTSKACAGLVIDDTKEDSVTEGKWNSTQTEYTYHGLHYDVNTRTVSFRVENLKAGCKLEVGINTKTPILTTAPSRMDFYNTAFGKEGGMSIFSNTTHNYIMREGVNDLYKVTYKYEGDIPINAPAEPTETNYAKDSAVNVATNPVVDGYIFSGWRTNDAVITGDSFVMPGNDVVLIGTWREDNTAKYTVTYNIVGDAPAYFVAPRAKTYTANNIVKMDETERDANIDGYIFSGWNVTYPEGLESTNSEFVMPSSDVEIESSFTRATYSVCYEYDGSVIPPNTTPPDCSYYSAGEEVTTPDISDISGYKFLGWHAPKTFTMPEEDVIIQGEWMIQAEVFSPEITKEIIDKRDSYIYGETVRFRVVVKNPTNYNINNIILEEKLAGAKFIDGDNYRVESDTFVTIPSIAPNSSINIYAEYQIRENTRKTYTNTVELIGATADDNRDLDTTKDYIAQVDFNGEPEPVTMTGIVAKSIPYIGLIILAAGLILSMHLLSKNNNIVASVKNTRRAIRLQNWKKINKVYIPIFFASLSAVVALGVVWGITNATTYTGIIKAIELTSQHTSFDDNDPGAWKVKKSAFWYEEDRARIVFDLETVTKSPEGKNYDIVMVVDNSGSMAGSKIERIKTDTSQLVESVLSDPNNRIGLVTFNARAAKRSDLTNDKQMLLTQIQNLNAAGDTTNFYDGLVKAREVLADYQKQENRELVLLFLTDGYPSNQTPNEVAEYKILKQLYPYIEVAGVQYETNNLYMISAGIDPLGYVLDQIVEISDLQYLVKMDDPENILFEASRIHMPYEEFRVEDYIESDYWTLTNIEEIIATAGNVSLTEENGKPKVTWDLNGFSSGSKARILIHINLKDEFKNDDNLYLNTLYLNTNDHENIISRIEGLPSENITSELTPVLKSIAKINYEPNAPSDCTVSNMPNAVEEHYPVSTVVQISDTVPVCEGYIFSGWRIASNNVVKTLNSESFVANDDTVIRATWGKLSINKRTEGKVYTTNEAILDSGQKINGKLKRLAGQASAGDWTRNTNISSIEEADSLPSDFEPKEDNIISSSDSPIPIYAWYDSDSRAIYIYSDAKINAGSDTLVDLFNLFYNLSGLDALASWDVSAATNMTRMFRESGVRDIDALASWDTSNVTSMRMMFESTRYLQDLNGAVSWNTSNVTDMTNLFYTLSSSTSLRRIDALASWDTSSVTDMHQMFYGVNHLEDVDALASWDTSKVTDMGGMFAEASYFTNIDGLASWDTSSVTDMSKMFSSTNIQYRDDISALASWDTSSVTDMSKMFFGTAITKIDALASWDTSNVTNMNQMFTSCRFTDISALASWDVSKVTDMNGLFSSTYITDIDALASWDTSSVETMATMFMFAPYITNIDGAASWNTSSVTNMNQMFRNAVALTNIDGAANWDVSSVTDMGWMFYSATALRSVEGAANWNVSSLADANNMFNGTKNIDVGPLESWNPINLTSKSGMFSGGITNKPSWY